MKRVPGLLLVAAVVVAWGLPSARCVGQDKAAKGKGTEVELGTLKSRAPADWKEEEPTPIQKQGGRYVQFRLPGGDGQDAELIIYYFQGQGGSVEDNVKRWKGMFVPPEGKKIDDVAKVEKFKVGDVPVTYLDVHGTYKFKKAPFVPDERAELRPNHRMIAVYFDNKGGPYFLRLVGPAKTVERHKASFDEWLKAFK